MAKMENKDIRGVVNNPQFRLKVLGGVLRAAESFANGTGSPTDLQKVWSKSILNDREILYSRQSTIISSLAILVVVAEMKANSTKTPRDIVELSEVGIKNHLIVYIPFFIGA